MTDPYIYEPFEDGYGRQMWSCRREGSGICGYGRTDREALEDFLDKEDELVPLPRGRWVGLGHPEQPPEFVADTPRDEDYE